METVCSPGSHILTGDTTITNCSGGPADIKVPLEKGRGSSSAVPSAGRAERGCSVMEWGRVCFSCGRPGHGVNWCLQVDTSFPFLSQDWSVDIRDGQYQAKRTGGAGMWSTPGNEGWSGREGQPPGSSGTKVRLTAAGEMVDRGEASRHGSCRWGVGLDTVGHRACMLFRHWGAIPHKFVDRITDSCRSGPSQCWEAGARLCRTLRSGWAGAHCRWCPRCPELGSMGGGCGLPEGISGLHKK